MYLMSPLFCEKGGILFKGGHYVREDIIQGNTVCNENEHTIQYRGEKSFIVYLHNISRVSTHLVLVTAMFSIESEQ